MLMEGGIFVQKQGRFVTVFNRVRHGVVVAVHAVIVGVQAAVAFVVAMPRVAQMATASVMFIFVGGLASAQTPDPVTLPDIGVDMEGLITALIDRMGTIVVLIVGGYFSFLIVKKLMKWGGKAIA